MIAFSDDMVKYLYEANYYINKCVPVSEYDMIFESEDPVVQKNVENNDRNIEKSQSSIGKALAALGKFINGIISSIGDFFRKMFMSNKDRANFDAFCEQIKNIPELRNKKITVKTYQDYMNRNDALVNKLQGYIDSNADMNSNEVQATLNDANTFLSKAKDGLVSTITIDAAIRAAHADQGIAMAINKALKADKNIMDQWEASVGEKEANKAKKEIEQLTGKCKIKRAIASLRYGKMKTVDDVFNSMINPVVDAATGHGLKAFVGKGRVFLMGLRGKDNPEFHEVVNQVRSGKKMAKHANKAINKGKEIIGNTSRFINPENSAQQKPGERLKNNLNNK